MRCAILPAVFLGLAVSFIAWSAPPGAGRHQLMNVNGVRIDLPWSANWVEADDYPANPDTVAFRSRTPHALFVVVTAAPRVSKADTDAAMDFYAKQMVDDVRTRAVEKNLQPVPLAVGTRPGLRVSATDKAPKPDEYRFSDMVVVMDGDNPIIAKIAFNEAGRNDARTALVAIADARIIRP